MEILVAEPDFSSTIPEGAALPEEIMKQLERIYLENLESEKKFDENILKNLAQNISVKVSNTPINNKATSYINVISGNRSAIVAQQSKFSDMIIAAAPPKGKPTATFEAAIKESGKPVMIIPREMKSFSTDNILIGWNNTPEASRAISESIPILKRAKNVLIISSYQYMTKDMARVKQLQKYLKIHDIDTTFEAIKTTLVPGEALLDYAENNKMDMIIAGAYKKGIRELFLGGSAEYILRHTKIPAFVSH